MARNNQPSEEFEKLREAIVLRRQRDRLMLQPVLLLGVPFYLWRKLPYHHTVWHFFVLAGSVLHYLAVLLYVLPDAPR